MARTLVGLVSAFALAASANCGDGAIHSTIDDDVPPPKVDARDYTLVPWGTIARAFTPPLRIETQVSPRP